MRFVSKLLPDSNLESIIFMGSRHTYERKKPITINSRATLDLTKYVKL